MLTTHTNDSKQAPYALDAERSVIGGILIDNQSWEYIEDKLIEDDFYSPKHKVLFHYMYKMFQKDEPVDMVTLSDYLTTHQKLEKAGGFAYIAEIANETPQILNVRSYADIVKEKSLMRSLMEATWDIGSKVQYPEGRKAQELVDYAEQKILSISELRQHQETGMLAISNAVEKMVDQLERLAERDGNLTGYDTGFRDLNEITSGLHPSNLVIIAARPSMGKTVLGVNLAENVAQKSDKPVLIFSLEMPSHEIVMRMVASQGRVEMTRLRDGKLQEQDWINAIAAMDRISALPIYIDDTANLTPMDLRSRARRIYRESGGLSMILVDYLGSDESSWL